jgi:hypothetical protein
MQTGSLVRALLLIASLVAVILAGPALSQDTDGDGLTDAEERALVRTLGFGPPVVMGGDNSNPEIVVAADVDYDGDLVGLSDGDEVNLHLTDPLDRDSDGDLFGDEHEVLSGTDPNDPFDFPNGPLPRQAVAP